MEILWRGTLSGQPEPIFSFSPMPCMWLVPCPQYCLCGVVSARARHHARRLWRCLVFRAQQSVTGECPATYRGKTFGCLLEELIRRCLPNVAVDTQKALKILADLQAACVQEKVSARPLFDEIVAKLNTLVALLSPSIASDYNPLITSTKVSQP